MAGVSVRNRETSPLPPLTRAHQEVLRASLSQLSDHGQDVAVLTQLIEAIPRLRSGLSAAERQRVDELDANHDALQSALQVADEALGQYDTLQDGIAAIVLDAPALRQLAEAARQVAEAAGEVALRAAARAGLLE